MITVYLDTSDYSAFGDVERGIDSEKAQAAAPIYQQLLSYKRAGVARFAYSMPILSELLQYNPAHSETSFAKARAVEALCGKTPLSGRLG